MSKEYKLPRNRLSKWNWGSDLLWLSLSMGVWLVLSAGKVTYADQLVALGGMSEEAELYALLNIIETETEIATNSKMNADYVPGIVTVLEGVDIEALGARTVWEALRLSPGVEITINNPGLPIINMRAVGYGLQSGQVMMQLNSVPINRHVDGMNLSVLLMPVEQVERIEIIRGPGSALHGGYAYTGVVNVVTRKGENRGYVTGGSFDSYGGGVMATYSNMEKEITLNVNGGYYTSDGAGVDSGSDHFAGHVDKNYESYAPGPTNEQQRFGFGAVNFAMGGFSLLAQIYNEDRGSYFGVNALNPPTDEPTIFSTHQSIKAIQRIEINDETGIEIYAIAKSDSLEDSSHLIDPPYSGNFPSPGPQRPGGPGHSTTGFFLANYYEESAYEGGIDFFYNGLADHEFLMGLSYGIVSVEEASESHISDEGENSFSYFEDDLERSISSFYAQDQYSISEDLTVTVGGRYDSYDDAGENISPRVAAVWHIDGPHIVKAQYAHAYRAPTFYEMYSPRDKPGRIGNPDLEPELSVNYELGYTFKKPGFTGRVTLFSTQLNDFISVGDGHEERFPRNAGETTTKGVETEGIYVLSPSWKSRATLTFSDAINVDGDRVPNSAQWVGNVSLIGEVIKDITVGLHLNAIGDRARRSNDSRENLEGYQMVNLTVSAFNVGGFEGLTARVGGQNILDADIRAPSMNDGAYPDDLPRAGATWFAQVAYTH